MFEKFKIAYKRLTGEECPWNEEVYKKDPLYLFYLQGMIDGKIESIEQMEELRVTGRI